MTSAKPRSWGADDSRYQRVAEKKAQVMIAAQRVFIENGYQRASMDAIALAAGVGKMTVYRQFQDKETLFIACMNDQCRDMLLPEKYAGAKNKEEAKKMLIAYGKVFVELVTRKEIVMLYRTLIGETNHFRGLGSLFYQGGPSQAIHVVEKILENLYAAKDLRMRAQAFFWAALGDSYEKVILGVLAPDDAWPEFSDQIAFAAEIILK